MQKMYTIGLNKIIEDIGGCLLNGNKVAKRKARLGFILQKCNIDDNQKVIIEDYLSKEVVDKGAVEFTAMDFIKWCIGNEHPNIINLEDMSDKERHFKVCLEAQLTSSINSDGEVYMETCKIVKELLEVVRSDEFLNSVSDKWLFYLKGGMATKIYLNQYHGIDRRELDETFGFSDNDTGFMIDPDLPEQEYNSIFTRLVQVINDFLDFASTKLRENFIINKHCLATHVVKVSSSENKIAEFVPYEDRGFNYRFDTKCLEYSKVGGVYSYTSNMLNFYDDKGNQSSFWLGRLKSNFNISASVNMTTKTLRAELLDVTVTGYDDYKNKTHYHSFKEDLHILEI